MLYQIVWTNPDGKIITDYFCTTAIGRKVWDDVASESTYVFACEDPLTTARAYLSLLPPIDIHFKEILV